MNNKKITPAERMRKDIVRYTEQNPFDLLRNRIDKVFDSFFADSASRTVAAPPLPFHPNVDVKDSGKEIRVIVELPGMDEKDIDISLNDNLLTIKGEKKAEKEEKGDNYYHTERTFGYFSRTVPLPSEVRVEDASAAYKNGILKITLPKTERVLKEAKKIQVRSK